VLAYKHRLFSCLLSSASLNNFKQAIRKFPHPETVIVLQLLLRSLLLCEQGDGQVNTPQERRQERNSKAKSERERSALLSSTLRGENSGLLQTLRQKLYPAEGTRR